ncbi:MAG: M64 family metallopeptidase [Myxococcales bacterium]
MTSLLLALLTAAAAPTPAAAPAAPKTFRVDFFHTGNATTELLSLDRLVVEPLAWPGSPAQTVDETNLGKYLFEVRERGTNRLVFSRGFASIYGEWETTPEAKVANRTFHESLRFPLPATPVQVLLKKRDAHNAFREIWSLEIDPKDMFVDPSKPASPGALVKLLESGEPSKKVDLLILGDGYTAAERGKFEKDAKKLVDILFSYSPFKERKGDFNVWGLCPPSEESGISRPSTGLHRRSRVGATYDAFGSERYILTFDNRELRDVASFAPYEFVEILANGKTYGGGGIFNLFATVASDSLWAPYIFVHELGHHFAGLGDEYYTSDTAYEAPVEKLEPWEPNTTANADPATLKWKALLTSGVPVPTPWSKEAFEKASMEFQKKRRAIRAANKPEEEMDALFTEEKGIESKLLSADSYAGKVGAFEGANYEAKGYYRPQNDCVMFSRNQVPFCGVCQQAVNRVIDFYSSKK